MKNDIIEFYTLLRQIFGICESCNEIFRVSDTKLYQKKKPEVDWKEKIDNEISRLERQEEELEAKIELAREAAREAGRKEADRLVKKIDPVFSPLKLNPNDAKVIFHPIDFIVFNGMNSNCCDSSIKNIILLDKGNRKGEYQKIQNSITKSIQSSNYEWLTLRVDESGTIKEE